jgi:hypothetical protein
VPFELFMSLIQTYEPAPTTTAVIEVGTANHRNVRGDE